MLKRPNLLAEYFDQPTKKLKIVTDRYKQIFNQYIEKCVLKLILDLLCIYS